MSGTKGYYGHALGASGAIKRRSARWHSIAWLPPTVNLAVPDDRPATSRIAGATGASCCSAALSVWRNQCGAGDAPSGLTALREGADASPPTRLRYEAPALVPNFFAYLAAPSRTDCIAAMLFSQPTVCTRRPSRSL